MDAILLQILNGLDKGSAYAMIALGLTLIFGTLTLFPMDGQINGTTTTDCG